DWVRQALSGQVNRSVSGSLGLWEFSAGLDGDKPYRELVPTGQVAAQRQALLDGVARLEPRSATQLYTSLLALYEQRVRGHEAGKLNRIVVLTDGVNDGGLTFDELTGRLAALKQEGKDVAVSIIAIGPDPERAPLGELARSTGGTSRSSRTAEAWTPPWPNSSPPPTPDPESPTSRSRESNVQVARVLRSGVPCSTFAPTANSRA
ncbi:hypothetical protein K7G98_20995, partial [Saccharothrix sp. MB29]|nr:hypothetical protein [Saccharothrix sp. MB29]